jgi:hypothetical protein
MATLEIVVVAVRQLGVSPSRIVCENMPNEMHALGISYERRLFWCHDRTHLSRIGLYGVDDDPGRGEAD